MKDFFRRLGRAAKQPPAPKARLTFDSLSTSGAPIGTPTSLGIV